MSTNTNTIYTVTTDCQDCYRCVRACPVKAIRVSGGQAKIESDLCIYCGTCVRTCPQHAKIIRSDTDAVKELLASGRPVAASVAPSFAALYGNACDRLPSVLRQLGFRYVAETAEAAKYIAEKSFDTSQTGNICTACPVVIEYAEKYRPQLLKQMVPITSPMIAHGRMLKERYNDCAVVFIGPCAAKKEEMLRPENAGAVDAVITFDELSAWLEEAKLSVMHSVDSGFDSVYDAGDARLFPLEGGMMKTGGIEPGVADDRYLKISGADAVIHLFEDKGAMMRADCIEPLFCEGGCIFGPAMPKEASLYERRKGIIDYWEKTKGEPLPSESDVKYAAVFTDRSVPVAQNTVSESAIQKILAQTGKLDPIHQLNCEACGYKTCIENAKAIVLGMAEPEMCVPYMRRLAQQRTDRIIDTSPNGVVVLDSDLNMIKMNDAFQKMFMCNNSILGRRISYLINAYGFEQIQSGAIEQHESIQSKYGFRYHEILYALRDERQYVGMYTNLSNVKFNEKQLDLIKYQTLTHAREFLDHQIRFAQDMAHYLGRSTAESEDIAKRLIRMFEDAESGDEK